MPSWKSQFPVRRASLAAATGLMLGLPSTVPLMAQQQAPGTSAQAASKSEITRQLEALYERDGRPMPQMVVPRYQPQPAAQGQAGTPQAGGYVQPTAGTQKKGLLYRLLPSRLFRDRSREQHTVPSAPPVEPPTMTNQPSQPPAPVAQQPRLLPGAAESPRAMPHQAGTPQQPAAISAQPMAPAAEQVAETPAAPEADPLPFLDLSPAPPAVEDEPVVTATKPEIMIEEPVDVEEVAEPELAPKPAPVAATATADDPFDNLFPEEPEEAVDETKADSPYTGLTLDEDPYAAPELELEPQMETPELAPEPVADAEPREMPADDAPFAPPIESDEPRPLSPGPALSALPAPSLEAPPLETPPAAEAPGNNLQQSDPVRSKMDRIAARHNATGLKGFCPVMLRDHRELVDARETFRASYKGREYLLSSAEAVAAFQAMPAAYAPALGGNDVIHYAHTGEYLAGSLDHAVWYKGRLYMFASAETLEAFAAAPSGHATDE